MNALIKHTKLFFSCLLTFSSFSYAAPPSTCCLEGHLSLQTGAYWSNPGRAQHVDIISLIGDEFTLNSNSNSNALVGIGYFPSTLTLYDRFDVTYGINGFFLPRLLVSGTVIQENLFENLSYRYEVTNWPLYAEIRSTIALPTSYPVSLQLLAGIGPNFIRTDNFEEHSLDNGLTIPDNIFSGRTTTTFSATAGVGLQLTNLFGNIPLSCGYRFFYLGRGHLTKNNDQVVNALKTKDNYANALVCGVQL